MRLFTMGYEGMAIDSFVARLRAAGIAGVLDVRELPLSRKPGFSKNSFAEALNRSAIGYRHLPALGCPKLIRDRYRRDDDWFAYTEAFNHYLSEQGEALADLVRLSTTTISCLVCFETDFNRCHRSLVARAATRLGGPSVVHLTAKTTIPDVPAQAAA